MASGWLLLAGGAFWTLNSLGAGVCLGHWLARQRQPDPSSDDAKTPDRRADEHDPLTPLAGEVARGVAQAGAAVRKAEWLSAVCDDTTPKPTPGIRTAVRELTSAVRNLHVQIGSIFAAFESLRSVGNSSDAPAEKSAFPSRDVRAGIDLIGRRRRLGAFEPPPPPMRFPYPCRQWVAPCRGQQLPTAGEFFPVQCRHLDRDGIAFYVDNLLPAEKLVISLGDDELKFMLAQVVSEHAQPPGTQGNYMLVCRCLQRLEPGVFEWNAETGVIEAGHQAVAASV